MREINNRVNKLALVVSLTVGAQVLSVPMTHAVVIEEVLVTTRKVTESMQDVPIAVSAFSSKLMNDLGMSESGDIALFTPSFTWHTEFGRASPQPYMRGIGTNNFAPINNGPIAVYQDNVFIGPNIAQGFSTFDIERVEVLKGPQGTLYGRNSTGGLINFISKKPTVGGGLQGYVSAEAGSFNTRNIEAAAGFDLGQSAAGRISVLKADNDGAFDNINPDSNGEAGIVDDVALRAQLLFTPSDRLSILANYHYGKAEPDTAPFKNIGLQDPNGPNADPSAFFFPDPCPNPGLGSGCTDLFSGVIDDPDIYKTAKADDEERVEAAGVFLQIDYDIDDGLSLHSLTSYDEAEIERWDDTDDSSLGIENDYYADEFEWFSQELRLSGEFDKSNWHVGAYYYNETAEGTQIWSNPIFGNGEGNEHQVETTSYAFFGQYGYDINESWRFTGGLRWSYEEKDIQKYNGFMPLIVNPGNNGDGTLYSLDELLSKGGIDSGHGITIGNPNSKDWDEVTGRISIDYSTESGNLIYFSLARGFKGGDVNGAAFLDEYVTSDGAGGSQICPGAEAPGSSRCAASVAAFQRKIQPVDPELLDSAELGFKGDFMEGKLRLNGAVFYYDYQDQQNTSLVPVPGIAGPGTTTLENAASSSFPGAEIELIVTPGESWYVQLNAGWVDAEYDDFGAFSGNQISLTPKTQVSGLLRYDMSLENGSSVAFQVDSSWQSKTYFQPSNVEILSEDSYALWGARIAYTSPDEAWTVALYGKNLTEEEYFGSGFDVSSLGWHALKPGAPRYFGLQVDYRFGDE